ncbi:MAG: MFS transporter [Microlunatus sp.]|nr:MFS transporter [Microlunatus sp.]
MPTDQPSPERGHDVAPEPMEARTVPVSRRALAIGICTTVVAIAFESIAVATAMPVAARELNGLDYYAWAFSLFLIGMLFATVVTGRLSDRIGPGKPLFGGMAIFAVGLIVAGTAEHMLQLVAGRLVQGLGGGVMNTAAFVLIAHAFDAQQRPRMFTYISTAWVLPAFVGPPISAWLTVTLSWHWVFFAVLPLIAFAAAVSTPTLLTLIKNFTPPPVRPDRPDPAPIWAAAVIAGSAAAIQLAGQRLDLAAIAVFAAGLVGLLIALPRLMPAGFLRWRRGLPAVIWVRALLPGAFFGAESFLPLMLVEQRQVPLVVAGAMLTLGSVGWTTAAWLQSQTWLPIRRDRLITYGTLSVGLGIVVCVLVAVLPGLWFGGVGLGWIFAGFGMGLATASTGLAVMNLTPAAEQGRNGASLNLGDALGSSIFVGISGSIFAALHGTGNLSLTFGVLLTTMVVVGLMATASSLRIGPVRDESSRRL